MKLRNFIGTKQFYQGVIFIAVPILIQNIISNFVSLLDNLMVGRVGTEPMSGVAIINQLVFVYTIGVFGLLSGISIFTAQYYGKGDQQGVRYTFKMKLVAALVFFVAALFIFTTFGDSLIWQYLHEGEAGVDLNATFGYAKDYLTTILWGLPPFAICQAYASTLRDIQETRVPMIASVTAVAVNLCLNYVLIYGKFGAPELGVVGAAIATNISRYIECAINIIYTHSHKDKFEFIVGAYKRLHIPGAVIKKILLTAAPLFCNEILWSSSVTVMNQIFSERGIEVVSAVNIASTTSNLFSSVYLSMGIVVSIMVGNALGAGDPKLAIDTDRKLIFLSFSAAVCIGIISFICAPAIANFYNTELAVKKLASTFIRVLSCMLPVSAVINASYFTIRSGGKTLITFLFDSCSAWLLMDSTAFILVHFTDLNIVPVYTIVYATEIIKLIVGLIMVSKKIWVNNLVS